MPVEFISFTKRPYPDKAVEYGRFNGEPARITRNPLSYKKLLTSIQKRYGPDACVFRVRIWGGRLREFPQDFARNSLVRAILTTQDMEGSNNYYFIKLDGTARTAGFLTQVSPEHPLYDHRLEPAGIFYSDAKVAFLKNRRAVISFLEIRTVLTNPLGED